MRFHIGCSFRPKNLLKYIFPFLLGILAMLGIENVNAATINTNYDSYFNVVYDREVVESTLNRVVPGVNKTTQEIIEYAKGSMSDNNPVSYIIYLNNLGTISERLHILTFTLSSCPYTEHIQEIYGYKQSNVSYSYFSFSLLNNNNRCKFEESSFYTNDENRSSFNASVYSYLASHMQGQGSFVSTTFGINQMLDNITFPTNDSYTINNYPLLYDTNTTIVNKLDHTPGSNDTNIYYFKSLTLNGVEVPNNTQIPSYLQLLEMQGEMNSSYYRLPYNYFSMNKTDISSFSGKFKYSPSINADDYVNLITGGELNFYGRYNHNNDYYTYEQINCTLSRLANINSNKNEVTINYNNLSCSSDLTNYDKVYIYESFKYDNDSIGQYDLSVFNASLTSNVESYTSNEYKGNLYEPLTLQNGFKILISSNSQNKVNYITNNNYLSFNKLSNEDITHINNTISGVEIGYEHIKSGGRLQRFYSFNVGTYDRSMYYLYDNYTLHSIIITDLKLFYENPSSIMLSFPVVINGEDTFSYYNNEGNVTNGTTIQTNYGDVGGNYSQHEILDTSLFDPINNFLDSIEEDLISMHELNQAIFDNIPNFIKVFIVVIYSLFLLNILFKEVKR